MAALFDQIISVNRLRQGWRRVNGNGGGPGGDGVSLARYADRCELRLERLHGRLAGGTYFPGPLRRVAVPKKSGGVRVLAIPCVEDRIVQTAAAQVLSALLDDDFSPDSHGWRRGKSVQQAVARVASLRSGGYPWVVDGDIRAFFDEVPHEGLMVRLEQEVEDRRLLDLVASWLRSFDWGDADWPGRGLAQGSPISPLLANMWLDGLDQSFSGGPVRIVRFGDDFVLLTRTHRSAEAALDRAAKWLSEHGLALNHDKTRIVPFEQAFDYLGHLFMRALVLQREDEPDGDAAPSLRLGPGALASDASGAVRARRDDEEEQAATAALVDPETALANVRASRREPDDDLLAELAGDRDPDDFAAGLAPLYVMEAGSQLGAAGECFTVANDGQERLRLPAQLVGRIELGPRASAEEEAFRLAADHAIPLAMVNGLGAAQSTLLPACDDRAGLQLAQARLVLDEAQALHLARALVTGRLRNAHALLKRLNRRRKLDQVTEACERIKYQRDRAGRASSIDVARGFEGEGARHYWRGLGACLAHGFGLHRRRGVEGNPVVAVLNFTASLLLRDMEAAVLRAGLNPGFGALHASADRRDACVYDLVEAFRAPLAEGLSVYLFNNRILKAGDFATVEEEGGVRLAATAARRVVEEYERWIARPIRNPRSGSDTSWRGLLLAEARGFAAALRQGEAFAPYELDF